MAGGANVLLIRYMDGWTEKTDAASIAAWRRKEAYLKLGNVDSTVVVDDVASTWFDVYASPIEELTAGVEPASISSMPGIGWHVGDVIRVPDSTGTPSLQRVMSIAVSVDADTNTPVFSPTFEPVEQHEL